MKKLVTILLAVALVSFASFGCIFKGESGDFKPPTILKDKLETFYTDSNKNKIVVIGQNYHYILEEDKNTKNKGVLFKLLEQPQTEDIAFLLKRENFTSDKKGYVSTSFLVKINTNNSSNELVSWAKNLRINHKQIFYKYANESDVLVTYIYLVGYRYQAKEQINSKLPTLLRPIDVDIFDSNDGKKVKETPLTVDNNGSLILNNQKLILLDNLEDRLK